MFDAVRNNKRFIQIVLLMIVLPFALWGVDSYVGNSGGLDEVANVGGTPISASQFQEALREQQERLRPQLGAGNQDLLESPQLRRGVLEELINQRLLALHANQSNLQVSDAALAGFITAVPSLQENGKFSRERYQALVAAQGMSMEMFEAKVRQDLLLQQAMMAIGNAAVSGKLPVERWLAAQLEERVISEAILRAEQLPAEARPDAAAIQRYYEENRLLFEKPEQVRVEYLVLSQENMIAGAKVSEEEVKAWYQTNEARYKQAEQRQASHILIRADKDAPAVERKAAQEKAEQILAQLKVAPGDFAKLAKLHSQDPGSAEKGGDLGYFGRGMMVKPFEDEAFNLKENQLSEVVSSDFGFHLIKLTGVRPEQLRPLSEVRAEIITELKRQAGTRQFATAAEDFGNIVYEQADTLKPAAEKYGLSMQTSEWLAKDGQATAPFTNPKLRQAIFSEDALKNKRNTAAIDIGANTLLSAHVIEHQPAALEPLETVTGMIEKVLARETALARMAVLGQANLEKLKQGEKLNLSWSAARAVSRLHAPNLSAEARDVIFAAATQSLPAYVGTKAPSGFALYRIEKIKPYDSSDEKETAARSQALRQQYDQVVAQEELVGWLAALRQRYPVKIKADALERK